MSLLEALASERERERETEMKRGKETYIEE